LCFISTSISFAQAPPIALVGFNGSTPDAMSIVLAEDVAAGTKIYFTDAEYVSGTNAFNSGEGTWSWTAPAGGLTMGEAITFTENAANVLTLACSSGGGAACGTFAFEAGSSIAIGSGGVIPESIYAYTDTDNNKENGITDLYAVIYSNGAIPVGESPATDFPNAFIVDGFSSTAGHRDFNDVLRPATVDRASIENPANYITGSGARDLSEVVFADIALPVELMNFEAEKRRNKVDLNWVTSIEINNDYFEIQRSLDGEKFDFIGKEDGQGTTFETSYYEFSDRHPFDGLNYYRLKQVDLNGDFTYTKIVSIEYKEGNHAVAVYPNPFEESVTVQISSEEQSATSAVTIEIFDVYGRFIKSFQQPQDAANVTLDLSGLSNGAYILKVSDNYRSLHTERIMKF